MKHMMHIYYCAKTQRHSIIASQLRLHLAVTAAISEQQSHLCSPERRPCCHLQTGRQLSAEYGSGIRLKTARNLSPLFLVTF